MMKSKTEQVAESAKVLTPSAPDAQLNSLAPWKPLDMKSFGRLERHMVKFDIIDGLPHIRSLESFIDQMELAHYYLRLGGPVSWVGGVEDDPLRADEASRLHKDNIGNLKSQLAPAMDELRLRAKVEPGSEPDTQQRYAVRQFAALSRYSKGIGQEVDLTVEDTEMIDAEAQRLLAERPVRVHDLSKLMQFYSDVGAPRGFGKKIDVASLKPYFMDRIGLERERGVLFSGLAIAQIHYTMRCLGTGSDVSGRDWELMMASEQQVRENPRKHLRQVFYMNELAKGVGG